MAKRGDAYEGQMVDLDRLLTPTILSLKQEADDLDPHHPVSFDLMRDERAIVDSAGATLSHEDRRMTILVDPARVTEYMLGHELMHVILLRSGYPVLFPLPPHQTAPTITTIAEELTNVVHENVFHPRLVELGLDVAGYNRRYIEQMASYPLSWLAPPLVMKTAFYVLGGLLLAPEMRNQIVDAVERNHIEALKLARELERLIVPTPLIEKRHVRNSLIRCLDHLDQWIAVQASNEPYLRQRIGVSTEFSDEQQVLPAEAVLQVASHQAAWAETPLWVMGYVLREDGTRIYGEAFQGCSREPGEVQRIRQRLETESLTSFLGPLLIDRSKNAEDAY